MGQNLHDGCRGWVVVGQPAIRIYMKSAQNRCLPGRPFHKQLAQINPRRNLLPAMIIRIITEELIEYPDEPGGADPVDGD
jgi:hypothetical protein